MLEPIELLPRSRSALRAWDLLADTQGGWSWAGLEPVIAMLGPVDIADLIDDLSHIQGYWCARRANAQNSPSST